jgi:malate dehydrogenase (oxaloacetate-decarboxylating)
MDVNTAALYLHKRLGGKLEILPKFKVKDIEDLSLVYTPGVAEVCRRIHERPDLAYRYTIKRNTVAIVSDGSAVLGLGNIGPLAALPVMEGKALLFKSYADIDAFPLCISTQNPDEIIQFVKNIAPTFAGINLEDIAAPGAFEIEQALQDIGIPVFHDDQHGTSIVTLAALINAAKVAGKHLRDLTVVVNGAGAAGTAIAELLLGIGDSPNESEPVRDVIALDSKGILHPQRPDLQSSPAKLELARITNRAGRTGGLAEACAGADVFIGVSKGNVLTPDMVRSMAPQAIVFAMANPTPEIHPDDAYAAGAFIVASGRSDFPNQVNNVLAFPGVFRGALDAQASRITHRMRYAAAHTLAATVRHPDTRNIVPSALDKTIAYLVADAVRQAWEDELAEVKQSGLDG